MTYVKICIFQKTLCLIPSFFPIPLPTSIKQKFLSLKPKIDTSVDIELWVIVQIHWKYHSFVKLCFFFLNFLLNYNRDTEKGTHHECKA